LLLAALAILFPAAPAAAEIYVLEEPILRATEVPLPVAGATALAEFGPTLMDSVVYGMASDPASAGFFFAYQSFFKLPKFGFELRLENELYESIRSRRMRLNLAQGEGIESVHVLQTKFGEQYNIYLSRVNSSSIVFAETKNGKSPPPFEGKNWISVGDTAEAGIRFRINVPGSLAPPQSIDVPLEKLLNGARMDFDTISQWRQAVAGWDKKRGAWARYATGKGLNDLQISASLVRGGEELALGEFTHGKGVKSVLGLTQYQKLKALATLSGPRMEDFLHAKPATVGAAEGCAGWFRRIVGKKLAPK